MRLPGSRCRNDRGQQADDVVALDESAVLVEQEAAVVVAVPGDRAVGAVLAQRLDGARWFSTSIGFGTPFGKRAVRLVMDLDELERQVRLELVDDQAGAAIAGMHDDLERLELRAVDVRQQVLDVRRASMSIGEALADARGLR